ncbi:MAG: hypothetical protein JNM82_01670 [Rhodocyclaceae bacterium]|nr:hypothetical protein [Rhodocyclaceae bacterium]
MIAVAGLLFVAMGLVSGLLLVLHPFGLGPGSPGLATWFLFPGLTLGGYLLLILGRGGFLALASSIVGSLLLLLAVGAVGGIFAVHNGLAPAAGDTAALWYVAAVGLVLGPTGLSLRKMASRSA